MQYIIYVTQYSQDNTTNTFCDIIRKSNINHTNVFIPFKWNGFCTVVNNYASLKIPCLLNVVEISICDIYFLLVNGF